MKVSSDLLRIWLAILLLVHGVAHLPAFLVPWRLAVLPDLPYRTTLLRGTLNVGPSGIRLVGVLWLIGALGFGAAALLLPWKRRLGHTDIGRNGRFAVALPGGPTETRIGLVVHVLLLVGLALAGRTGGFGNK
jgi:hypothetical protein